MNDNFTNSDKLVQYLDGELHGQELEAMEKSLSTDKTLATELNSLRQAKQALKMYGVKNRVESIHKEMMQEFSATNSRPAPVVSIKKIWQYGLRIAALLIVLAGIAALFQFYNATPDQLYRGNFETFSLRETRGSAGNGLASFYRKGRYEEVITEFKKLAKPVQEDYFLNALAFLQVNNTAGAIQNLKALQEINKTTKTHLFEEDAAYYLGLAYLKNNDPAKALPIFHKIYTDKDNLYHGKVSGWFMAKLTRLAK